MCLDFPAGGEEGVFSIEKGREEGGTPLWCVDSVATDALHTNSLREVPSVLLSRTRSPSTYLSKWSFIISLIDAPPSWFLPDWGSGFTMVSDLYSLDNLYNLDILWPITPSSNFFPLF